MISKAFIQEWKAQAPWRQDHQIEQDLILSRCLVEIYNCQSVKDAIAFRGGTALQKLFVKTPFRYSEDIDLVQIKKEPIGKALDEIRGKLDTIFPKKPQVNRKEGRVTLIYRFESADTPPMPLKLKIEINIAEHFNVYPLSKVPFEVSSKWFSGKTECLTYDLNELMGTKIRALYQRKKGRDLFDLYWTLKNRKDFFPKEATKAFEKYIEHEGNKISRAEFEQNLAAKKASLAFGADVEQLLPIQEQKAFDTTEAFRVIEAEIAPLLKGEPWAGDKKSKK
ncbi:MAG: nucleotidyl transferase AbiEii/AbiGii toxin family protein [Bdellovibrionales bacterium]|nr:nucleotidyl transferase AbiEii/AbiGii toxin family protein [Bdellovibrionales bacterium]